MKEVKLDPIPGEPFTDHSKIYAFVCPERGEGIVSFGNTIETQRPMVCMSLTVAEVLTPVAEEMARITGKKIELREYTMSKIITTILRK
jgi:hypothetical protein